MPEVRAQIIVGVKSENAEANLKKIGTAGVQVGKDLKQGLAGGVQALTGLNLGTLGVVGGLTALGAGLKYSIDQAAEAEKIFAITEAVVKSTGGAAGFTAEQIADMAGRLSQLNAVDDETIQSAQNLLLTFKSIKGEGFEAATQAAIDMSVVMGTDLRSSVTMVGKALEDPIRGVTALRRAGVSFTEEQRKMIRVLVETGRTAEAQEFILAELNTQVGGAGVQAAKTYAGQLELLKVNMGNFAQSIGEKALPALNAFLTAMNENIRLQPLLKQAVDDGVISQQEQAKLYLMARMGATDAADAIADLTTRTEAHQEAIEAVDPWLQNMRAATEKATTATGAYDYMIGQAEQSTKDYAQAQADAEAAVRAQERAIGDLALIIDGPLGEANRDFAEQQAAIRDRTAEIQGKIDELNRKTYLTPEQQEELGMLQTELSEQQAAMETTAAKHEEMTARIIFDMVQQRVAEDGFQEGELEFLATIGEAWGIYDKDTATALANVDTALATSKGNAESFLSIMGTMQNVPDVHILIETEYRSTYTSNGTPTYGTEGYEHGPGRAHGGPVMGGNAYLVGERGPELFVPNVAGTVVPNGAGMGGNEELIAVLLDLPNAVGRAVRDNLALVA